MKLSQVIIKINLNHILCFDNLYTSMHLLVELAKKKFFVIGFVRSNSLLRCIWQIDSELKKEKEELALIKNLLTLME